MIVKFYKSIIYSIESMYCTFQTQFEFENIYMLSKKSIENNFLVDDCKQAILRYKKRNDLIGLINYINNAIDLKNTKIGENRNQKLFFDCKKLIDHRAEPLDDLSYFAITTFGLQKLKDTHQMEYYKAKNFWDWSCNEAEEKIKKNTPRGQALFALKIVVDNTLHRSNIEEAKQNLINLKSMIKRKNPA